MFSFAQKQQVKSLFGLNGCICLFLNEVNFIQNFFEWNQSCVFYCWRSCCCFQCFPAGKTWTTILKICVLWATAYRNRFRAGPPNVWKPNTFLEILTHHLSSWIIQRVMPSAQRSFEPPMGSIGKRLWWATGFCPTSGSATPKTVMPGILMPMFCTACIELPA